MSSGLRRPVKPLDRLIRVSNVPITQYKGPAPRADCPCGSRQPARRCHCAEDLSWIAQRPPALLTDARTGYAKPGCYGRASNDCSEDLTLEHYISDDLLESIAWDGKVVMVRGAAWLPSNTGTPVGVNSLSSRMLCGRHADRRADRRRALADPRRGDRGADALALRRRGDAQATARALPGDDPRAAPRRTGATRSRPAAAVSSATATSRSSRSPTATASSSSTRSRAA